MGLWLAASDVVVLPYRKVSGSAIAARAIGARRPIAASEVGGLKEIVVPGVTGELFAPGDAGGLAEAVERILARGPAAYAPGLDRAAAETSWPRYAERILEFVAALPGRETNVKRRRKRGTRASALVRLPSSVFRLPTPVPLVYSGCMDFDLTEDQALLQTSVREFAEEVVRPRRGPDRPDGRVSEGHLFRGGEARARGRLGPRRARRLGNGRRLLRHRDRGDLARLRQHRRHPVGQQLPRLRPDREVRQRGPEEAVPPAARPRREARLLRPDRARRGLRRGQPEDPGRAGRRPSTASRARRSSSPAARRPTSACSSR